MSGVKSSFNNMISYIIIKVIRKKKHIVIFSFMKIIIIFELLIVLLRKEIKIVRKIIFLWLDDMENEIKKTKREKKKAILGKTLEYQT